MKTDNQRREFEFALETVLKAADSKIKSVKINWDERDMEFREAAKTVKVTFIGDYLHTDHHLGDYGVLLACA